LKPFGQLVLSKILVLLVDLLLHFTSLVVGVVEASAVGFGEGVTTGAGVGLVEPELGRSRKLNGKVEVNVPAPAFIDVSILMV
jgi:hypothetical protein